MITFQQALPVLVAFLLGAAIPGILIDRLLRERRDLMDRLMARSWGDFVSGEIQRERAENPPPKPEPRRAKFSGTVGPVLPS